MYRQEINITSFEKYLPKMLDLVIKGDEIIITKSNVPIAKISPIQAPTFTAKVHFDKTHAIRTKMNVGNAASENWFG
ncbi:MAG: hypothetical protein V3V16_09655 [Melioribacteraceae bacterium]